MQRIELEEVNIGACSPCHKIIDWPDAWLIAAVRRDPPDMVALDTLVERHWRSLYGRCRLLTLDADKAEELAQEAWCRILRARHRLEPAGSFSAYLKTIATNLWRDSFRRAKKAGPLSNQRLLALDAVSQRDDEQVISLADILPDPKLLGVHETKLLALDIDLALSRLGPQLRDVIVARFLTGESCAEIGRRYGRTEQTISAWVREGLRELKRFLGSASNEWFAPEQIAPIRVLPGAKNPPLRAKSKVSANLPKTG